MAWYDSPYPKGTAVGPAKLPRVLYPPSSDKGVFKGYDVIGIKRGVARAQRWVWDPPNWDQAYSEQFSRGRGTGKVEDSGVRGFQRQEWRDQPDKQTGILNDETYQKMRRARIPAGPNQGRPIFDAEAIKQLNIAVKEYGPDAKIARIRDTMQDFCLRAEANENLWHYTQQRPYTGLGKHPEQNHENDCSSYVILVYYWARQETGLRVPDPSGYGYNGYGNTWDDLDGHPRVTSGSYQIGDLAHYDGHVTICRRAGDASGSVWSSFGSEGGPLAEDLFYRGDFIKVVRPTLMVI